MLDKKYFDAKQEMKIYKTNAKIVVRTIDGRLYYEIEYNDLLDGERHTGYGSFDLEFVFEWLYADVWGFPTADDTEMHGHWVEYKLLVGARYCCDICGGYQSSKPNYCPNCGAKMDSVKVK